MPGYNPDAIIATGYYRLGIWDDEPADPLQALFDGYDDIVATTGQAFLGLTLNCARCHDHKFDPIPQTRLLQAGRVLPRHPAVLSDTRDVSLGATSPTSRRRSSERSTRPS